MLFSHDTRLTMMKLYSSLYDVKNLKGCIENGCTFREKNAFVVLRKVIVCLSLAIGYT